MQPLQNDLQGGELVSKGYSDHLMKVRLLEAVY
jgi:hypothetical protein